MEIPILNSEGNGNLRGFQCFIGSEKILSKLKNEIILPMRFMSCTHEEDKIYTKVSNICPTGIIISGPVGCGKSYLVRELAWECSANLLIVNCGDVMKAEVGATEHILEELYTSATMMTPCILFFEDLDMLCNESEYVADSGRSISRVSGCLAHIMDRINSNKTLSILMVATCNNLSSIDSRLIQPHRFSEVFNLSMDWNIECQASMVELLLQGRVPFVKGQIKNRMIDFLKKISHQLDLKPVKINSVFREAAIEVVRHNKLILTVNDIELSILNLISSNISN
eukprot:GHVL01024236.1.p1 GENE.GHVL01024236.1~~GHVL01024236.1.p1  ORF type:complete len:283 (-),score=52.89 GHVL01024236.1:42-890(-)